MRRIGTLLAVVGLLIIVTGCPKKKGEVADAAAEAAVAAVDAAPAGPEAANADQVARFPDEAVIDHTAAALAAAKTNVRKTPPSGEVIASLNKGTNVVQIASHDKYVLITFEDPKNSSQRLMGWVIKDSFSSAPVVHPKGACPAGQTLLLADTTFCGKVCKADSDCPSGSACTGNANIELSDGGAGDSVKDCIQVARPDAGPPPPAPDAGPNPTPPTPDAGGGGGGGGGGGPIVVDPKADGTCPAGYKAVDYEKKCHKNCQKNEECGAGAICTRGKFCKAGP